MSKKVFCATLGCDKNIVDSELLLGRFIGKGVRVVDDPDEADIWIINTCGFIEAARSDSEELLDDLIEMKEDQTLVVCGCWSQEHGDEIQKQYPEVDVVAGVGQFDQVVAACLNTEVTQTGEMVFPMAGKPLVVDPADADYSGMVGRPLLTPPHLANVKIAEGCNCNCTFCRIPIIRGKQSSRSIADIVSEVRNMASNGVTEIQLVSQNTSDFGRDTGEKLYDLVFQLNSIEELRCIRLLYLYAGLVSVEDLVKLMDLSKVAPYLDLPVQHASPRILKAMKRPGGPEASVRFFQELREHRPDVVLRSTAMLGFPGEEEEDVSLLADFLAEVKFDHLGTYRYSPEQGTPAAEFDDQVSQEEILDREALIMDLQAEISMQRQISRMGNVFDVVVDNVVTCGPEEAEGVSEVLESLLDGQWLNDAERSSCAGVLETGGQVAVCRSWHYGYDLDGLVLMPAGDLTPGQWVHAEFRAVTAFDTWAAVHDVNEPLKGSF